MARRDFKIALVPSGTDHTQFDDDIVDSVGITITSCGPLQLFHRRLFGQTTGNLLDCFNGISGTVSCRVFFVIGGRELYDDIGLFDEFAFDWKWRRLPTQTLTTIEEAVERHKTWALMHSD